MKRWIWILTALMVVMIAASGCSKYEMDTAEKDPNPWNQQSSDEDQKKDDFSWEMIHAISRKK